MSLAVTIGLGAGLLQALAHLVHAAQALRGETRPNAAAAILSTAGSLAFCVVGARLGAPLSLLILPAVGVLCPVGLAVCVLPRDVWLPPARRDRAALALGAAFVAAYAALAVASADGRLIALAGVAAAGAAWPILNTTFRDPGNERPLAWLIWSAAYGLMTFASMLEGMAWPFLVYPVASLALDMLIGLLALEPDDSLRRSDGRADGLDASAARLR